MTKHSQLTGALLSGLALPEAVARAVAGTSEALAGVHPAFAVQEA
ncbi:hypothetical protein ACT3R5_13165 [Glutamicibacter sp. AOP5-A2-7]